MFGKKGREKKILLKKKHRLTLKDTKGATVIPKSTATLVSEPVKVELQPIYIPVAISASNIAGGTVIVRSTSEVVRSIPKEQLSSMGLSGLPEKVDAIGQQLEDIQRKFRGYFGRSERALGDLIPMIVQEYYEGEGYRVTKSAENTNKEFKIDLIAERNDQIRVIQVKKGAVSSQEIHEIFEKAQLYFKQKISDQRAKIVDIIASDYPIDYLQIRDKIMEMQKEIAVNYMHFYQITRKMPKYRYLEWSGATTLQSQGSIVRIGDIIPEVRDTHSLSLTLLQWKESDIAVAGPYATDTYYTFTAKPGMKFVILAYRFQNNWIREQTTPYLNHGEIVTDKGYIYSVWQSPSISAKEYKPRMATYDEEKNLIGDSGGFKKLLPEESCIGRVVFQIPANATPIEASLFGVPLLMKFER